MAKVRTFTAVDFKHIETKKFDGYVVNVANTFDKPSFKLDIGATEWIKRDEASQEAYDIITKDPTKLAELVITVRD